MPSISPNLVTDGLLSDSKAEEEIIRTMADGKQAGMSSTESPENETMRDEHFDRKPPLTEDSDNLSIAEGFRSSSDGNTNPPLKYLENGHFSTGTSLPTPQKALNQFSNKGFLSEEQNLLDFYLKPATPYPPEGSETCRKIWCEQTAQRGDIISVDEETAIHNTRRTRQTREINSDQKKLLPSALIGNYFGVPCLDRAEGTARSDPLKQQDVHTVSVPDLKDISRVVAGPEDFSSLISKTSGEEVVKGISNTEKALLYRQTERFDLYSGTHLNVHKDDTDEESEFCLTGNLLGSEPQPDMLKALFPVDTTEENMQSNRHNNLLDEGFGMLETSNFMSNETNNGENIQETKPLLGYLSLGVTGIVPPLPCNKSERRLSRIQQEDTKGLDLWKDLKLDNCVADLTSVLDSGDQDNKAMLSIAVHKNETEGSSFVNVERNKLEDSDDTFDLLGINTTDLSSQCSVEKKTHSILGLCRPTTSDIFSSTQSDAAYCFEFMTDAKETIRKTLPNESPLVPTDKDNGLYSKEEGGVEKCADLVSWNLEKDVDNTSKAGCDMKETEQQRNICFETQHGNVDVCPDDWVQSDHITSDSVPNVTSVSLEADDQNVAEEENEQRKYPDGGDDEQNSSGNSSAKQSPSDRQNISPECDTEHDCADDIFVDSDVDGNSGEQSIYDLYRSDSEEDTPESLRFLSQDIPKHEGNEDVSENRISRDEVPETENSPRGNVYKSGQGSSLENDVRTLASDRARLVNHCSLENEEKESEIEVSDVEVLTDVPRLPTRGKSAEENDITECYNTFGKESKSIAKCTDVANKESNTRELKSVDSIVHNRNGKKLRRNNSKIENFIKTNQNDEEPLTPPVFSENFFRRINDKLTREGLYDINKPLSDEYLSPNEDQPDKLVICTEKKENASETDINVQRESDLLKDVVSPLLKPSLDKKDEVIRAATCLPMSKMDDPFHNNADECILDRTTLRYERNTFESHGLSSTKAFYEKSTVVGSKDGQRHPRRDFPDEKSIYDVYPAYDTDDDSNEKRLALTSMERKLHSKNRLRIIEKIYQITSRKDKGSRKRSPLKIFRGNPIC